MPPLWLLSALLLLLIAPVLGVGPTPTITLTPGQADPTNTTPVQFRCSWSASVSGFVAADVTLNAGTTGATSVNLITVTTGLVYDIRVMGIVSPGSVSVSLAAGVAVDGLSNPSLASVNT